MAIDVIVHSTILTNICSYAQLIGSMGHQSSI
jgi:hypothetical protein